MSSVVLAAALLAAVSASAALLAGSSVISQAQMQSGSAGIDLIEVRLQPLQDSDRAFLSFSARNSGAEDLASLAISATASGKAVKLGELDGLGPGMYWKNSTIVEHAAAPGSRQIIKIEAYDAGGARISDEALVVAN